MKYSVLFHNTPYFGGIEVQPPLPEEERKSLKTAFDDMLNSGKLPKRPANLRNVSVFYYNGGAQQEGTHFIAMPNTGNAMGMRSIQNVADHVGRLLAESGHEISTIEHRKEWDGQAEGSRKEPPAEPQFVPEPEIGPESGLEPNP